MSNIYSRKEVRRAKKAMIRDTRFSRGEREESAASLDKLVGARKGGLRSKKIIKDTGLSIADRGGVKDILGGGSRKSSITPKMNQPSTPSGKPRTSWWQAVSSRNVAAQNQGTNSASKPRKSLFGLGTKSSSSKNYDELRNQFGNNRASFTSNRGTSTAKPRQTSPGGLKKLF